MSDDRINLLDQTRGRKMRGLTSKQHLFARLILVVILANAAIFYNIFRNPQVVTVAWQFAEFAISVTAVTLFALTVNLQFWWKNCISEEQTISQAPKDREDINQ